MEDSQNEGSFSPLAPFSTYATIVVKSGTHVWTISTFSIYSIEILFTPYLECCTSIYCVL